jgi:hypothetical protein
MGRFAEHARAEGAVAHGGDDIADARAFSQIQGFELFELQCFQGFTLAEVFRFVTRESVAVNLRSRE